MDLSLQPQAPACFITQQPFAEGQRVVSFLVRVKTGEAMRYDTLESERAKFEAEGVIVCSWVRIFKPRKAGENAERDMKLTAEALFLTLADPQTEVTMENTRLLQFLALMLERKRVLKPKGRTSDGARTVYEHTKSKQFFEVAVGELSPEFFIQVQEQLSVLMGPPAVKAGAV
jgi:hypothetical protein